MPDDNNFEGSCEIKLVYSGRARTIVRHSESSITVGNRLARIQGLVEQAIAQEFQDDPVLVSANVRFRRSAIPNGI